MRTVESICRIMAVVSICGFIRSTDPGPILRSSAPEDTGIASYADDNTPYVIADNIDSFIKSLEEALEILFK